MDKAIRQCPQTTTFLERKKSRSGINRGPSAYQPNALPLDQTGSLNLERYTLTICTLIRLNEQSKRFAIEPAVDFISVLEVDFLN